MHWDEDIHGDEQEAKRLPLRAMIRRILPLFRPHRRRLVGAALLMLITAAAELAGPLIVRHVLDTDIPAGDGGGVLCVAYSCPTIENCVFELNSAGGNGGGLASVDSAPMIRDCIFKQNSASGNGGGISETIAPAGVQGCTFWGNTAGWLGGGLYGAACGDPEISHCTFYANSATIGGGICMSAGSAPAMKGA